MRRFLLLGTILGLLMSGTSFAAQKSHKCKAVKITEHDINKASSSSIEGYVIDQPGKYKICGDVLWKGTANNSFAITIKAQDVTLILAKHTIKQENTSASRCYAIWVSPTAGEVNIRNGTIEQFSGGAILNNASCVTIDSIQANHCCYNGMTILDNGRPFASAIANLGTGTHPVEHIVVKNCRFCDTGIIGEAPVAFTGSISGTSLTVNPSSQFVGSISPNNPPDFDGQLTVTAVNFGQIYVGQEISGPGILPGTVITSLGNAGFGGVGTYTVNKAQTVPVGTTMVTGPLEPVNVGYTLSGPGVAPGTVITGKSSVTNYTVNIPQTVTYAATTVALGSDNLTLPQATLNVASTLGFPSSGQFFVGTTTGNQLLNYSIATGTSFNLTPGGTGTLRINNPVIAGVLFASDPNALFIPQGKIAAITTAEGHDIVYKGNIAKGTYGQQENYTIQVVDCHSAQFHNNIVQDSRTTGLFKGFFVKQSQDVVLEDNLVSNAIFFANSQNIKPASNGVEGTKVSGSTNVVVRRTSYVGFSSRTEVPTNLPNSTTLGIQCNSTSFNALFEDCTFQNMNSDGGQVINTTIVTGGLQFSGVTNCEANRCFASNMNAFYGPAFGIGSAGGNNSDNIIRNCTANDINVLNKGSWAAGFPFNGPRYEVLESYADRVIDSRTQANSAQITVASNGLALPQATINVDSTAGFPPAGVITVTTTSGPQLVTYTGLTNTTFTGAALGTGTMATGNAVVGQFRAAHGIYMWNTATAAEIKGNNLTNCSTSAIYDATAAFPNGHNSFITGNFASLNGTPSTVDTNYNNLGGAVNLLMTPIRNWPVNSLPVATTAGDSDNVNAHN